MRSERGLVVRAPPPPFFKSGQEETRFAWPPQNLFLAGECVRNLWGLEMVLHSLQEPEIAQFGSKKPDSFTSKKMHASCWGRLKNRITRLMECLEDACIDTASC